MDDPGDADLTHESLVHDLNNVFETISEAAELLSGDEHWKPLAATLGRSVARGKRLLDAIPDRTPNLANVVEDAIQSVTDYTEAARKPRMRLVKEIDPNIFLPGSDKDWERVFVNLFLNVAQAMHKPGRIDISAVSSSEGLSITVSDNGPGIPAEILPRIFKPHVSSKEGAIGEGRSGLGLHIVASIIRKYAGRITAQNRERGTGAIFTIFLPGI
jgi:signal transduction histidine kinase